MSVAFDCHNFQIVVYHWIIAGENSAASGTIFINGKC